MPQAVPQPALTAPQKADRLPMWRLMCTEIRFASASARSVVSSSLFQVRAYSQIGRVMVMP